MADLRKGKLYLCGHCHQEVSKTLYYHHKKLFYNKRSNKWQKDIVCSTIQEDFRLSGSDTDSNNNDFAMLSDDENLANSHGCYETVGELSGDDSYDDCGDVSESEFDFSDDSDNDGIELLFDEDAGETVVPKERINTQLFSLAKFFTTFLFFWQNAFRISDVGIDILLKFVSLFLVTVARMLHLSSLRDFALELPNSANAGRKVVGTSVDDFKKFACCRSCSSIYPVEDCIVRQSSGEVLSKKCSFVRYPNHPQEWRRKACECNLMKHVKTSASTVTLKPFQIYCYKSLVRSLNDFVQQPAFFEQCESWRGRKTKPNHFCDVYDGAVWKEFMEVDGVPFLSMPYNFALSLNVDWFQPYKHTQHSIGVLYIAILNLPREVRFLAENIIIVGVIPGPNEPSKNINSYLAPLVDELQDLWNGVVLKNESEQCILVRAALICVACDIPAARKVCGFVGHQAFRGCSKCLKSFPVDSFGEKADYSGFDRDNWPLRDLSTHRQHAFNHKTSSTASERAQLEREHGVRYSVLLQLP